MQNLKQIAKDMRDMAAMLIQQADEIEGVLGAVDLSALSALVGNLAKLGGGGSAPVPFAPSADPNGDSRQPFRVLPLDQKQAIKDHWDKLAPKDQTLDTRKALAKAYGIPLQQMSLIAKRPRATAPSPQKAD
jgi:hypothetical protein